MKEDVLTKANAFKDINELALRGEIVIFGSTYMSGFPFYDLINKSKLEHAVYNRSIEGLTIDEAIEIAQTCVADIKPSKVFLALGEEDSDDPHAAEKYTALVNQLRALLPAAKFYLICLQSESNYAIKFNQNIAKLCDGKKVFRIEFAVSNLSQAALYKERFKELCRFFRSQSISFSDAFAMADI
ncbi:MAG: hypothetical protein IJY27_02410 [Clostridia bacterium]|nr:hypothetical protein [Clostridia bacterium]